MSDNIFVYKEIKSSSNNSLSSEISIDNVNDSFKILLEKRKKIKTPFSYELFPQIVINIKWKFDYFTNIRENPLLIINDLIYWDEQAEMLIKFQEEKWINDAKLNLKNQRLNNIEA